jgi:type I restriction enzyme S subunit
MKSHFDTEYNEVELGQVCRVGDGAHSKVERKESGIPYITSKNIEVGHLDTEDVDYISEEDYRRIFPDNGTVRRPKPGDVLIGIIGSFGNAYRYTESDHFGISSAVGVLRPDESKLDSDFLYYVVTSDTFRAVHESVKGGSVQGYTNTDTIQSLPLVLPPLPVQRRIADILGALDDKIELNRRMNETLEEMARALYRHWFVDFGPFQDREFKDTEELGPIPKGWDVKPFLDTCDIETGGTPKTSVDEYWGGDILWASAKDVSQNTEPVLLDPERTITPEGLQNSPTDVLPAGTTAIVARGATTGRHTILGRDMAPNQSCYGLVGKEGYSRGWTYLTVNSLVERLRKRAYGSAFDSVTISTFENLNIVGAPKKVISDFNERVMPLFERMMLNVKEDKTLAETRDYLLPKLISGEIEADAAEEVVEAKT